MAYKFPSEEWMTEFGKTINASKEYKKLASTWEWPVGFIFNPQSDIGLPEGFAVWADLWHGECREIKRVTLEEAQKALIRGNYTSIKEVFQGKLAPAKATVQGKIKVKGNFATLVKQLKAIEVLIECGRSIPCEFLDE